jgi:hypothetical protein
MSTSESARWHQSRRNRQPDTLPATGLDRRTTLNHRRATSALLVSAGSPSSPRAATTQTTAPPTDSRPVRPIRWRRGRPITTKPTPTSTTRPDRIRWRRGRCTTTSPTPTSTKSGSRPDRRHGPRDGSSPPSLPDRVGRRNGPRAAHRCGRSDYNRADLCVGSCRPRRDPLPVDGLARGVKDG